MGPIASRPTTDAPRRRPGHPGRALALLGTTAALGLGVAGCGSGHDDHSGPAAGTTTAASTRAANAVDRAFVAQMIPHHQMAVEMASYAKDRAEHGQIRTLGAQITRTQDAEIAAMRAVAKQLGVTPAATPSGGMEMGHGSGHASGSMASDARALGVPMNAMGMSMDMDALRTATPFDRAFIDEMLPHHQGAIRMARAELAKGANPELRRIATAIVASQKAEIERMNAWRKAWHGSASPKGGVPAA